MWTTEKRGNSHGFVTLQFEKFFQICAITVGRKKTSVKHCYLHGIVTCPYFLGPENGVRFLRRFSFRCSFGHIFVALFVESSFGTFLLWSCTSQGMRHFHTSIAIDDNTSWSQHWGVLRFCCWHCLECVLWAFSIHCLWNPCARWSLYCEASPCVQTLLWSDWRSFWEGPYTKQSCRTEAVHSVAPWTRVTLSCGLV